MMSRWPVALRAALRPASSIFAAPVVVAVRHARKLSGREVSSAVDEPSSNSNPGGPAEGQPQSAEIHRGSKPRHIGVRKFWNMEESAAEGRDADMGRAERRRDSDSGNRSQRAGASGVDSAVNRDDDAQTPLERYKRYERLEREADGQEQAAYKARAEQGQEQGGYEARGPEQGQKQAGPLAKKMWSCAQRNVRSDEVWARFAHRVLMTGSFVGAQDIALMFIAFARVKYRDRKALDAISPFLLSYVEEFSATQLVLILNAHKKLEYQRLDSVHLLLNALCARSADWTGKDVSLAANAVAYFYVYMPRFWSLVAQSLPNLVFTMNPLELSNLVAAMARVDRRDPHSLLLVARMSRRCASNNLYGQETLATSMNAFAKLDFNHSKLSRTFEVAALVKIDRALELGPDYQFGSLKDKDIFDIHALTMLFHTLMCLVGADDEVILKLLTLVSWCVNDVNNFQRRSLKISWTVLRKQRPDLYKRVPIDVREAMFRVDKTPANVTPIESRWLKELSLIMRKMEIKIEITPVVDEQVMDILLPSSNAVVYPVGPYGYYANSTNRTAYSKLHQRLLTLSGYSVLVVPYFEWSELKTEEDKMVYLWSMGRRAANKKKSDEDEAAPETVPLSDLSDLSDRGESHL